MLASAVRSSFSHVWADYAFQIGHIESFQTDQLNRARLPEHQSLPQLNPRRRCHTGYALLPATKEGEQLLFSYLE